MPPPCRPQRAQGGKYAWATGWTAAAWPTGLLLRAWTVVQFARWLTGQLLAGEPVGLPAGCLADMRADQLRRKASSELLFFRGLAVFGDSFTKMTHADVKNDAEFVSEVRAA